MSRRAEGPEQCLEARAGEPRHARIRDRPHKYAWLEVIDHAGFDPAEPGGGLGLTVMRERAAHLGGTLHVESARGRHPDRGRRAAMMDAPRRSAGIRIPVVDGQAIEVVGETGDGAEAVQLVERLRPDVVMLDVVMPGLGGPEAIRLVAERRLTTRVLVFTSFATDENVFPAIKAGTLGYLLKDSEPEDMVRAIRQVHRGVPSLHPEIARKVLLELNRLAERRQPRTVDPLTPRELDVLRLVARGLSNQEIARQLMLGETTVRTHVSSILGKLQLASRTQAALYALREGHATLDDAQLPD